MLILLYYGGIEVMLTAANAREVPQSQAPNLTHLVERASSEMDVPPPRVMVGEFDSPNAFAVGRRGNGTVVVSESLVELLEPEELAAVLSHEIAHIKNRDVIPVIIGLSLPALFVYATHRWKQSQGEESRLYDLLFVALNTLAFLFVFPVIRYREFVADDAAAEAVERDALASALDKIALEHGYDASVEIPVLCGLFTYNTPSNFRTRLFGTHPSIQSRIDRLEEL